MTIFVRLLLIHNEFLDQQLWPRWIGLLNVIILIIDNNMIKILNYL